ncbi:MAG TPA: hypothetical protein VF163_03875, partial [Micromonosporaceae bacterium]
MTERIRTPAEFAKLACRVENRATITGMATGSADRPWIAAYPAGVPADIAVPTVALTNLLDQAVRRYGPRTALDF